MFTVISNIFFYKFLKFLELSSFVLKVSSFKLFWKCTSFFLLQNSNVEFVKINYRRKSIRLFGLFCTVLV